MENGKKLKFETKIVSELSFGLLCKFKVTLRKRVHPLFLIEKYFRYYIFLAGVSFVRLLTVP